MAYHQRRISNSFFDVLNTRSADTSFNREVFLRKLSLGPHAPKHIDYGFGEALRTFEFSSFNLSRIC